MTNIKLKYQLEQFFIRVARGNALERHDLCDEIESFFEVALDRTTIREALIGQEESYSDED